ncbi:HTH-type transcriptional regulator GntR [Marinovum algicola]|uniref:Transcriptional regulator, LacI family n=1 Tax=Marinovum algicola TaxID=42444 RepID=A0A975ZR00_9RHOB|nr:LacI family DNA-binding transcriptional regulator [Marinovum algicola]SEK10403.1 transcriptional regulator, LacI family [Marinovum algicola]SLN77152.1 HTH-type transcriptional regulator GntR [Marinovum algicola]
MKKDTLKIEDVAKAAQVSRATAWRALNRPDQVSAKTVERVKMAARTIGYVPDISARTLRTNQSGLIAMIVPAVDSGFGHVIEKVSEVALNNGREIILGVTGYDTDKESELIRQMLGRRASVLILSGNDQSDDTRALIAASGAAVIQIWEVDGAPIQTMIGFSNFRLGYGAAECLIGSGRRNLALLYAPRRPRSARRIAGFRKAITDAGLHDCDTRYVALHVSPEEMGQAVRGLLEHSPEIDGIYANGDVLALICVSELVSQGKRVPEDVSVLGFGNPYFADYVSPRLSRVVVPERRIGDMTADALAELLQSGINTDQVTDLGFEIIRRDSA